MILVTAAQMQALDRRTMTEGRIAGLTLMENAGAAVVAALERRFGSLAGTAVLILCGKGNNGGDGFVVARRLRRTRARVNVILAADAKQLTGDARTMYRRFVQAAGHSALHVSPSSERMRNLLQTSQVVVDALLGTGLSAPVTGAYLAAIQAINDSARPVAAVDLPSGLHADTGAVLGDAVRATLTITFGLPKIGLYVGEGIDHAGCIEVADIGIPPEYAQAVEGRLSLITPEHVQRALPPRRPASHKGTFGHVAVIAGSVGKTGAAALTAKAALRAGSGLVTVATPASAHATLEAKLLEVMTTPMPETNAQTLSMDGLEGLLAFADARSAVAIGPGLTTHPETVGLVRALVPRLQKPCVIDADALNAFHGHAAQLADAKVPLVLTPHPGEMARLVGGASSHSINTDRVGVASRFARDHQVVVALKGARTVVAHPNGAVAICPTGNPGMATAGTGDALTGIIASLLAQDRSAWEAACAGTYAHGLAGDLAAAAVGQAGMTASDLIDRIPSALRQTGCP